MILWMLACVETGTPAAQPITAQQARHDHAPARRVVAVGDLHGDLSAAKEVLQLAKIINDKGEWIAGDTIFVQTGDTTDRGPDSKGVIDLLRSLPAQAKRAGGEVHLLLGNHEVMNLQGDWRYVSPQDVASFGSAEARHTAFAPTGDYGRYLGSLPLAVKIDDTIFVHGGINATYAELGLDTINAKARAHYFDPVQSSTSKLLGADGPIWYRDYVNKPESIACPELERALTSLNAERMVVGHTTRRDGHVQARCGGRLTVIDIGISAHYGHHLGAWEALAGDARALLPSGPQDLPDP